MFQLVRRGLVAALVLVNVTVIVGGIQSPTALAGCQVINKKIPGTGRYGSSSSRPCKNASAPPAAPAKWTYCDNLYVKEMPEVVWTPHSESYNMYRYPDGRQDSFNLTQYSTENDDYTVEDTDVSAVSKQLVNTGDAPAYERVKIYCRASPAGGDPVETKFKDVWIPVMTPESVLERVDLFAQVYDELTVPKVEFDTDQEYDWLWVQVAHRADVTKPERKYKAVQDTDDSGWATPHSVVAWIEMTPVALSVSVESDAGEQHLHSCNLGTVKSGQDCPAKFTHSSSIANDGVFYGAATVEWIVNSNAGTFDGIGPITSHADFSVKVAEAMAVSKS